MNILGSDKERKILKLFAKGDPQAMDQLYAAYADFLAGVCHRYIPDDDELKDVLQESFIKIFTRINDFEYKGRGSLRAWLTRIVINEALMALRRARRENETELPQDLPDTPDEPPDTRGLTASTLAEMISRLPTGYRTVFNLYALDGLSHKEIAHELGITASTSASQFLKARRLLARMIKDYKAKTEQI